MTVTSVIRPPSPLEVTSSGLSGSTLESDPALKLTCRAASYGAADSGCPSGPPHAVATTPRETTSAMQLTARIRGVWFMSTRYEESSAAARGMTPNEWARITSLE